MFKIYLKNTYNPDFAKTRLLSYIYNLFDAEIGDINYKNATNYLNKNFNISINDLKTAFRKNIHCAKTDTQFIIYCDTVAEVKNQNLNNILDFINSGNLEVKETKLFTNIEHAVIDNIDTLYKYYLA